MLDWSDSKINVKLSRIIEGHYVLFYFFIFRSETLIETILNILLVPFYWRIWIHVYDRWDRIHLIATDIFIGRCSILILKVRIFAFKQTDVYVIGSAAFFILNAYTRSNLTPVVLPPTTNRFDDQLMRY